MPYPKTINLQALLAEITRIASTSTTEDRRKIKQLLIHHSSQPLTENQWLQQLNQTCSPTLMQHIMQFSQLDTFLHYLAHEPYYLASFGENATFDTLIAFSFGESHPVNSLLAKAVDHINGKPDQKFVQWEIADLLQNGNQVNAISLLPEETYLTTQDIVDRISTKIDQNSQVCIVAQSWHAPRCHYLCQQAGLQVVAGTFVDQFVPLDPQPWVRDILSWILKESLALKFDKISSA